ncbi:MAG TPA: four helix bundle protein [Cytophagaceae bacterium]|jgi:four helix bundle protein|nr:four helix bundle protein [Cytophagaceae bacterium]
MFDFEKLVVYTKAKLYNKEISKLLRETLTDTATKNQLKRSSLSIVLNIAEGTGRNTNADKRNFYIVSRGSVFECVAILDLMKDEDLLSEKLFQEFYAKSDELSRMLYAMIQKLQ